LDLWMPQNCPSHQALGKALPFTMPWRPSDFIMSHAFCEGAIMQCVTCLCESE
jgi:hypothetical protein